MPVDSRTLVKEQFLLHAGIVGVDKVDQGWGLPAACRLCWIHVTAMSVLQWTGKPFETMHTCQCEDHTISLCCACTFLQVASVTINCTDVVMAEGPSTRLMQRVLYCGNYLAACAGQKVTNRWGVPLTDKPTDPDKAIECLAGL